MNCKLQEGPGSVGLVVALSQELLGWLVLRREPVCICEVSPGDFFLEAARKGGNEQDGQISAEDEQD